MQFYSLPNKIQGLEQRINIASLICNYFVKLPKVNYLHCRGNFLKNNNYHELCKKEIAKMDKPH